MSDATAVILLIGRILFVYMFVVSARGHILNSHMLVNAGKTRGAPLAELGGWPIGVWMALGSASIVLGIFLTSALSCSRSGFPCRRSSSTLGGSSKTLLSADPS